MILFNYEGFMSEVDPPFTEGSVVNDKTGSYINELILNIVFINSDITVSMIITIK